MKFTKMHGAGNDFIIVDNRSERVPADKMSETAKALCPRRTAVGADGIMFLDAHSGDDADVDMHFFNADGSEGEMCGNGARCVARFAYEHGFSGETPRIFTASGIVTGERIDEKRYKVRLNDITVRKNNVYTEFEGHRYLVDYMEMGEPGLPHAVVELPGLSKMDKEELRPLGIYLRHFFPNGANVNFYELLEDGSVQLQILESSQIDHDDVNVDKMFLASTYFNPVDLVCGLKNYKGERFDLRRFVDKQTGFISEKSKDGRELKALEHPGLWNGAMSDWNTVFVDVESSTFTPVKTVNDLLRPEHRM